MPVYMDSSGKIWQADSSGFPQAGVIGLVSSAASPGALAGYSADGVAQRTDWSAIAGAEKLNVGAEYYLGASPGTITDVPPVSGIAVRLGRAAYNTTLDIEIGTPIQLQ